MLLAQETNQNISLELQNFTQLSNNQSVMECLSLFKNHLEDVIESLESVREKNEILKERETSINNLRNELHNAQTKN
jgi:cell shape-determining protein MreC